MVGGFKDSRYGSPSRIPFLGDTGQGRLRTDTTGGCAGPRGLSHEFNDQQGGTNSGPIWGYRPSNQTQRTAAHDRIGRSAIKRRPQQTRLVSAERETIIPLQQVQVTVLGIGWVFSRLDGDVLRRFQHIWSLLGLPLRSCPRESSRVIPAADAALLRDAGVITGASPLGTGSWVVPFSVV